MLLGVLLLLFVMQAYFYIRYLAAPMRKWTKNNVRCTKEKPGVSVIVSARNEGDNLEHYLQALLTQDYPEYEVIVVDDGSEDNTREVIERYMNEDTRLHTTFVPRNARVGSTKKLALTLAAKAARYDYLLLTDADCVPESNRWISAMMQGFADQRPSTNDQRQTDIVLGFGAYFYEKGHINRLVRYDTLFNGLHYLGAALCGHPYMGVGRNLAYRKQLFFESGGFSHLMNEIAGDDDLFVNHTATADNTAVVLTPDAYTWSRAKQTLREWLQQKRRHLSVSPAYKRATQMRLAMEPITRGLFYALVIAAVIGYRSSVIGWIAIGLFLLRWLLQLLIINISARRMRLHGFGPFSILWFDIVLPLISLWMLVIPQRKVNKW